MPNYYIWTIGCQMNEAESERLAARLVALGYAETDKPERADIIFLNSCVVRASAENKAVNKIAALKSVKKARPEVTIALTGCLVGSDIEQMQKRFPQVDYFRTFYRRSKRKRRCRNTLWSRSTFPSCRAATISARTASCPTGADASAAGKSPMSSVRSKA